MKAEKDHQKFVHGIEDFDKAKLAHAEPQVKNPLPDTKSRFPVYLPGVSGVWFVSNDLLVGARFLELFGCILKSIR